MNLNEAELLKTREWRSKDAQAINKSTVLRHHHKTLAISLCMKAEALRGLEHNAYNFSPLYCSYIQSQRNTLLSMLRDGITLTDMFPTDDSFRAEHLYEVVLYHETYSIYWQESLITYTQLVTLPDDHFQNLRDRDFQNEVCERLQNGESLEHILENMRSHSSAAPTRPSPALTIRTTRQPITKKTGTRRWPSRVAGGSVITTGFAAACTILFFIGTGIIPSIIAGVIGLASMGLGRFITKKIAKRTKPKGDEEDHTHLLDHTYEVYVASTDSSDDFTDTCDDDSSYTDEMQEEIDEATTASVTMLSAAQSSRLSTYHATDSAPVYN